MNNFFKKNIHFYLFIFIFIFSISGSAYSQLNLDWIRTWSSASGQDNFVTDMKQDDLGNTYLLVFYNGYNILKYNREGYLIWTRYYRSPNPIINRPSALAVDNHGNVYATGEDRLWCTVKYDSSGTFQWLRQYSLTGFGDCFANAIAIDIQSNIYITGTCINGTYGALCVVKYNSNGDTLYKYNYSNGINGSEIGNDIKVDVNQNAYVTGTSDNANIDDACTFKLNPSGSLEWMKFYSERPGGFSDTGTIDYGEKIVIDEQLNSYVMIWTTKRQDDSYASKCLKYSSSGNFEWIYNYYEAPLKSLPRDLVLDSDQNPILALRTFLNGNEITRTCKINKMNGDSIWERNFFNSTNKDYLPAKLITDEFNNIYVIGEEIFFEFPISQYGMFLTKYNSSGSLLWEKNYYINDSDYFSCNNIIKNNKGLFISATGNIESLSAYKSYLLKYNDPTNIENVNNLMPDDFILYNNYPNPFNSSTKIKYSISKSAKIKLIIYDILGKEIYKTEKNEIESGIKYFNIDLILNSGVYFYSVYVNNQLKGTHKMMVIK